MNEFIAPMDGYYNINGNTVYLIKGDIVKSNACN